MHTCVYKDDIFRKYTYINILYNGVASIFGQKARFTCQFYQTLSSLHPLYVNLMPLQPQENPPRARYTVLELPLSSPSLLSFISIFPLFYPFSPTSNLSTFFSLSLSFITP